ncbi:UBE2Z enzyme, partial [Atractosteus spatula]|nr:UBE2Z enzyme [Atractosteus spatula]
MAESAGEEASGIGVTGSAHSGGGAQFSPGSGNSIPGDPSGAAPDSVPSAAAAPETVPPVSTPDIPSLPASAIGVLGTAVGTAILAPSPGLGPAAPAMVGTAVLSPSIGLGVTGTPNLAGAGLLSQIHSSFWDPTVSSDWDSEKPSQQCILRIKRDIMSIYKEPPPGMFVVPDPHDMTKVMPARADRRLCPSLSLFLGNLSSLSHGALAHRYGLGSRPACSRTWTGPAWSPAQSISSVLISIQSLMTENPYHNEPGFEQERHPGDSKNYNECIRHETMRVAVCDMLDGKCPCPEALWSVMEKSFLEYYDFYEGSCKERLHLQGQTMQDPFGEKRGHFDYQSLLARLQAIQLRLKERCRLHEAAGDSDSDTSSSGTDPDSQGSSKP